MVEETPTLDRLFRAFGLALLELADLTDPNELQIFMAKLGWDVPEDFTTIGLDSSIIDDLDDAIQSVQELDEIDADYQETLHRFAELALQLSRAVQHFIQVADNVSNYVDAAFSARDQIVAELPKRLADYLVYQATHYGNEALAQGLVLLGFFELRDVDADPSNFISEHTLRIVHWNRLTKLVADPAGLMREVYGWGESNRDLTVLLNHIEELFLLLGIPAGQYGVPCEKEEILSGEAFDPDAEEAYASELDIPLFRVPSGPTEEAIGFRILPLPPLSNTEGSRLSISPYASGPLQAEFPLDADGWCRLKVQGDLSLSSDLALVLRPNQPPELRSDIFNTGNPARGTLVASLVFTDDSDEGFSLLSITGGSGVSTKSVAFGGGIKAASNDNLEALIRVGVQQAQFVICLGSADGFLRSLFSEEGIQIEFEVGAEWSSERGLHFEGSATLETSLALHQSVGPVEIHFFHLGLSANDQGVSLHIAVTAGATLGPVATSIERMGIELQLDFKTGNLGPINLVLGFKSPNGIGLSIDASGIVGGGFLEFDEPNQRYTGVLTLNFGDMGLTAIGLITTRMPDGSAGFALLINIGTTFDPPLQLGMGFTLTGVGGLIGVNRSMQIDALRAGLKNRALDSILFPDPDTVVANASQIISDLRAVFPPQEGRYVVGPMLKIGWGRPAIITADVGVFLEFPDPVRVVILGQLEAALPKKDKALVVIHLDILGVIDFDREELTFQASLYDSRILTFSLSGDSAFLLGWGRSPRFALSLGGFHPKFNPPPPAIVFAELKRLTLNLGKGDSLRLSCQAYLALTPNSLQFGAQVDLYASAGGFTAEGYLGFDVLFYFSPFSFEVEIRGGVRVKYRGVSLLEVELTLFLSGPTPWHARGKARIKLLFFSVTARFSFTWGRKDPVILEAVDPWGPLKEALEDSGNWSSLLPPGHTMVEALRSLETENSEGAETGQPKPVVVHPAGRLEVRQNVVPLKRQLEKYGNAPITGHNRFEITGLYVNSTDLSSGLEPVEEFFARGQLQELTADQRLSLPSFEKMLAGVTTAASGAVSADGLPEIRSLGYEPILINSDGTSEAQERDNKVEGKAITEADPDVLKAELGGNQGLSDATRRAFRDEAKILLSANDQLNITVEEADNRWRIYDTGRDRTYHAVLENGSLNVYGDVNWFDWGRAEVMVKASAVRQAVQRAGPRQRFAPLRPQPKVQVSEEGYCIVYATNLKRAQIGGENRNLTRTEADHRLRSYLLFQPEQAGELLVVPEYEANRVEE
jgi:hypothetical protein